MTVSLAASRCEVGLVEDDQPGIGEERPGDRDALALAAAQPDPALADGVSKPCGQGRR